jgi:hypothetical protein
MSDTTATSAEPGLTELADLHDAYLRQPGAASLAAWPRPDRGVPLPRLPHRLVYAGPQFPGSLDQTLRVTPSTVTGQDKRLLERGLENLKPPERGLADQALEALVRVFTAGIR